MKRLIPLIFCFLSITSFGQHKNKHDEQPKAHMLEIPIDTSTGLISYTEINYNDSLSKQQIFDRSLDWVNTNFGTIDDGVANRNPESGKIFQRSVFKMRMSKAEATISMDIIISVKDRKSKIQLTNFSYKYYKDGQTYGSTYFPGKWEEGTMEGFARDINDAKLKIFRAEKITEIEAFVLDVKATLKSYENCILRTEVVKKDDW